MRQRAHCTLGILGHHQHGKTTLTSALTKIFGEFKTCEQLDDDPQERERGLTIFPTRVDLEISTRHYSLLDCPGHPDFTQQVAERMAEMDGVVLVVSASDGPMHETRNHLLLTREAGLPVGVYMSKTDQVDDDELLALSEADIRQALADVGYERDATPLVRGCALAALSDQACEARPANLRELLVVLGQHIPAASK
jgi:elongation factor Tu